MQKIIVIGHKSPDLDAIASAVAYAQFLQKSQKHEEYEVIPVRAGEPNPETHQIFELLEISIPPLIQDISIGENDKFVLVDHNEYDQRHDLVQKDNIIEILDHHKININFTNPIEIIVRPYGCTCSIIYELFKDNGIVPSEKVNKLILSAIISDTVGLRSATTTGIDSQIAHELAENAEIDFADFTLQILKAKSDLSHLTPDELVANDYKIYDIKDYKILIAVIETIDQKIQLKQKEVLLQALVKMKNDLHIDFAFLAIQDTINVNTLMICDTKDEQKILEFAFTARVKNNIVDIGPKLSRKKEIAPAIEDALNNIKL